MKQRLGERLFKVIKSFGIKGAVSLSCRHSSRNWLTWSQSTRTIELLDGEDLRALAHLMLEQPDVLKVRLVFCPFRSARPNRWHRKRPYVAANDESISPLTTLTNPTTTKTLWLTHDPALTRPLLARLFRFHLRFIRVAPNHGNHCPLISSNHHSCMFILTAPASQFSRAGFALGLCTAPGSFPWNSILFPTLHYFSACHENAKKPSCRRAAMGESHTGHANPNARARGPKRNPKVNRVPALWE